MITNYFLGFWLGKISRSRVQPMFRVWTWFNTEKRQKFSWHWLFNPPPPSPQQEYNCLSLFGSHHYHYLQRAITISVISSLSLPPSLHCIKGHTKGSISISEQNIIFKKLEKYLKYEIIVFSCQHPESASIFQTIEYSIWQSLQIETTWKTIFVWIEIELTLVRLSFSSYFMSFRYVVFRMKW